MDIKVKALGGIISVGDARIKTVQSSAVNKVQGKITLHKRDLVTYISSN